MYEHILVTGGAGFVGSAIALDLRRRFPYSRITALDNLVRRGSELNLTKLRESGVDFQHGDVRCAEDLCRLPKTDLIIECSAEPSVLAGYQGSPEYLVRTNMLGCFQCLELARRDNAAFIFISTSRVYPVAPLNALRFISTDSRFDLSADQAVSGVSEKGVREDFTLKGSRSLYGMTKLAGELMVDEYRTAYGVRAVINRCGVIAGAGQMGKTDQGVVVLWLAAHYFRQPLRYIGFDGTGRQVRDILAIEDLCDLIRDQVSNLDKYDGSCLNVGGGRGGSLSLRELTEMCASVTGNTLTIASSDEERPADLRWYISDNSQVSAIRGWVPNRNPETLLRSIHSWIQRNETALRAIFFPSIG